MDQTWTSPGTGLKCRLKAIGAFKPTDPLAVLAAVFTGDLATGTDYHCGYVTVPKGHPAFGKGYGELPEINVHGGVTYGKPTDDGEWEIGFDTAHFYSTRRERSAEYCIRETESMASQLAAMTA